MAEPVEMEQLCLDYGGHIHPHKSEQNYTHAQVSICEAGEKGLRSVNCLNVNLTVVNL